MKKIALAVMGILVLGLFTSCIAMTAATPPTHITGGWRGYNQAMGVEKVSGGNVFVNVANDGEYTSGPIVGTFHQTFTGIIHFGSPKIVSTLGPDPRTHPPADFNWINMDRVFTSATVNGRTGGLTMRLQATGYGNSLTPAWDLEGTWVIIGGTGDLSGLHGQGTWWHTAGVPGLQYEGDIHFDP